MATGTFLRQRLFWRCQPAQMVQGNSTTKHLEAAEIHRSSFSSLCHNFVIVGGNVPPWTSCHRLQMKENVVWLYFSVLLPVWRPLETALTDPSLWPPFRLLKLGDGMDSLANLMAVIDQCGMTCAQPAKEAQPEAENSENESRRQEIWGWEDEQRRSGVGRKRWSCGQSASSRGTGRTPTPTDGFRTQRWRPLTSAVGGKMSISNRWPANSPLTATFWSTKVQKETSRHSTWLVMSQSCMHP